MEELEVLRSVLEDLKRRISEIPESTEKIDLQDPDLVIVTSGSGMKSPYPERRYPRLRVTRSRRYEVVDTHTTIRDVIDAMQSQTKGSSKGYLPTSSWCEKCKQDPRGICPRHLTVKHLSDLIGRWSNNTYTYAFKINSDTNTASFELRLGLGWVARGDHERIVVKRPSGAEYIYMNREGPSSYAFIVFRITRFLSFISTLIAFYENLELTQDVM